MKRALRIIIISTLALFMATTVFSEMGWNTVKDRGARVYIERNEKLVAGRSFLTQVGYFDRQNNEGGATALLGSDQCAKKAYVKQSKGDIPYIISVIGVLDGARIQPNEIVCVELPKNAHSVDGIVFIRLEYPGQQAQFKYTIAEEHPREF